MMSLNSNFAIKSCKLVIANVDINLSFYSDAMLQQLLKLFWLRPRKASLNSSKHWYIINYRATADTLHLDVHVAGIAKGKNIYIYVNFNSVLNFSGFRDSQTKGVKSSKHLGCLQFYT
jgi:hypothetical protein